MKKSIVVLGMVLCVLVIGTSTVQALITYDDGIPHNIDYRLNQDVYVQDNGAGQPTTVTFMKGGRTGVHLAPDVSSMTYDGVDVYGNSRVFIQNGQGGTPGSGSSLRYPIIEGGIETHDNAILNISDGEIGGIVLNDYSTATISGIGSISFLQYIQPGRYSFSTGGNAYVRDNSSLYLTDGKIDRNLVASDFAEVTISGGTIGGGISAGEVSSDSSTIIFEGTDFYIDGQPANYGVYTAPEFSVMNLTGTLSNGDAIHKTVVINGESSIVLVPEPTTLLLLGLGGLMLRRKR